MIELEVTGMTCGHCEMAVRKALAKVPGVTAVVKVDRTVNRAAVEGTPEVAAMRRRSSTPRSWKARGGFTATITASRWASWTTWP